MATPEDRSLSSGISIPRWMKTKTFDLEQSAFSPTELDDSFMLYYRNNSQNDASKTNNNNLMTPPSSSTAATMPTTVDVCNKNKPDFSKHTLYCQKFLQHSTDAGAQQVKYPSASTKTKPSGIDDGFKGEAAKCGTSVIRVAQQMVSGKAIHAFNIQSNKNCIDNDKPPDGFNPSLRRGSRSLPASPLSSPKSSPKSLRRHNKYFTGPFVVDNENHHGSWILSNLLSKRQALSQSSFGNIIEEDTDALKSISISSSIDDLNENKKKKQVFLPKASELREMNFWSPTSM